VEVYASRYCRLAGHSGIPLAPYIKVLAGADASLAVGVQHVQL
jgi:hypothetical protein